MFEINQSVLKKSAILQIVLFMFFATFIFAQTADVALESPDGNITVTFATVSNGRPSQAGGQLMYWVSYKGKSVIDKSGLSLSLEGHKPLGADVKIVNTADSTIDNSYTLLMGKASTVWNHCNALKIYLKENESPFRNLVIEARVYNDAAAFRYVVPKQPGLTNFRLKKENTEFRFSKDATTYSLVLPNFRSMYESEYIKLPISAFSNQGGVGSKILIGLPMLLDLPGVAWVGIGEADLRGYSSMYLVNPSMSWQGHWFESILAPQVEDTSICVTGLLPHHSAWRVLMISDKPGKLIESNVITSLNPPCAVKDVSWIKPGKASWNWWGGSLNPEGKPEYSTKNMEYYVDFAAKSGFPYMLIDAGWSVPGDITKMNGTVNIPDVVKYAKAKNVKVWIWLRYSETVNHMQEAFPLYEKWGVAGLKIDFIERDDQSGIDFYYKAAELGAKYHLMIDIHGATKPSGINRTYPNLVGYEAVLGMEQNKAGRRDNPRHQLTIPFTRMLVGPMDYTPGGFNNVTRDEFKPVMDHPMVMGTRAHQLAMYVVYESPFQMVSDNPKAYQGQPSFQFIKDVPTTWDETKVLNGYPGKYITVARRHGDEWDLGIMTNWCKRKFEIPLKFLSSGNYTAEIYADAPDADKYPKKVSIETKSVNNKSVLNANLAPGGGYAVRFVPVK